MAELKEISGENVPTASFSASSFKEVLDLAITPSLAAWKSQEGHGSISQGLKLIL